MTIYILITGLIAFTIYQAMKIARLEEQNKSRTSAKKRAEYMNNKNRRK